VGNVGDNLIAKLEKEDVKQRGFEIALYQLP